MQSYLKTSSKPTVIHAQAVRLLYTVSLFERHGKTFNMIQVCGIDFAEIVEEA